MEENIWVTSRLAGEYIEKLKVKIKYENYVHYRKENFEIFSDFGYLTSWIFGLLRNFFFFKCDNAVCNSAN